MKNDKWIYTGAIILVALLVIGIIFGSAILNKNTAKDSGSNQINSELEKYRSGSIPEECRLPEGQDLQGWKEHLGHHQNTLYCLDYYK